MFFKITFVLSVFCILLVACTDSQQADSTAADATKENQTRKILILDDSNGASEHGWVNQLKSLRPNDFRE